MRFRFLVVAVLSTCAVAAVVTLAQSQPEYSVPCSEGGAEPIALDFGVHTFFTTGCEISPAGGDTDTFRFDGSAGQSVRLTVTTSTSMEPRIVLSDSSSTVIADEACAVGPCSVQVDATLPATGGYTVAVSDGGDNDSGTYTLQLERIEPLYVAPGLADGAGWSDRLDPSTDVDVYRLEARAGETIGVDVSTAGALDPRVELLDPSGSVLGSDDCAGPCTATARATAAADGTYLALVSELGADETGDYVATFSCSGGACPGDTWVDGLAFPFDHSTFEWQALADPTATFAVARGDLNTMRASGALDAGSPVCLGGSEMGTSFTDTDAPAAGSGFFYVTRGQGGDGFVGDYDNRWGPSQVRGRTTTICDSPGSPCDAAIVIPSLPYTDQNNTCGAPAEVRDYNNFDTTGLCNHTGAYEGPELIYEIALSSGNDITLTLSPNAASDMALFLVSDCTDPKSCVGWADNIGPGAVSTVSPGTLAAGSYWVFVDSFYADAPLGCGDYTLEVSGAQAPAPELLGFDVN
jgi:hypothetical protein